MVIVKYPFLQLFMDVVSISFNGVWHKNVATEQGVTEIDQQTWMIDKIHKKDWGIL